VRRLLAVRLGEAVVVLLGVLAIAFFITRLSGDPVHLLAGGEASVEDIAILRRTYGFDRPLPVQFARFVGRMAAGDLLVLYSDGVPEAQDAQGNFYEESRLAEVIRRSGRETNARALMREIVRDVTAFRGETPQMDDMTVVVVKCLE